MMPPLDLPATGQPEAYRAFAEARRAMAAAFGAWAADAKPSPADLAAEIDGTAGQMRQMATLVAEPAP